MTDTPPGHDSTQVAGPSAPRRQGQVRSRSEGLPTRARRVLQRAGECIEKGRADEADRALADLAPPASEHPEVLRLHGIVRHLQGRHAEAIVLLRRSADAQPGDALVLNNLGTALRGAGDLRAAEATFLRACEADPGLAAAWFNLGRVHSAQLDIERAADAYARALECDPRHLRARANRAEALVALGRTDEVIVEFRRVLAQDPDNVQAWFGLANVNTLKFTAEDADALEQLAQSGRLSDHDRAVVRFVLVRALEGLGRNDEAFTLLNLANAAARRRVDWDGEAFSRSVDSIMAAFHRPPLPANDPRLGREVIFIVSLPRSGSTLVEQIVSSHSEVEGANELPALGDVIRAESQRRGVDFPAWVAQAQPADWERLGRDYLKRTERWRRSHPILTDKALSNWRYVGVALAMLPGARFINCRRDPVETCLSCFRQFFGSNQRFTHDLHELAAYWLDYDRATRFWQARYPHRMLDTVHERLLADPDGEVRRILAFCELPFEPGCLRFHENERAVRTVSAAQVRQPLRESTARAVRYGELLAPLRWSLGLDTPFAD